VRKALNENPLVQVGLIAVLVLIAGFLLLTRVVNQGSSSAAPPATDAATTVAPVADPSAGSTAATTSPSAQPSSAGEGDEGFVAGPGLPSSVVDAFDSGKTVALLVVRTRGIDDRALELVSTALATRSEVQLFVLPAKNISKYSRIASGVDVDRVPALVVISPKRLAHGGLPTASVSYGFRGPKSVVQAVKDAEYKGKTNLPYYPK
jgi:hypothetical protein